MATFWHTFHHDGKMVRVGGGARHPLSLYLLVPSREKVLVYTSAERADFPISPLPLYVLCKVKGTENYEEGSMG